MAEQLQVANHQISETLGWSCLIAGARAHADVVRWYDCGGEDAARPPAEIRLETLGRLVFLGLEVSPKDAVAIFGLAPTAPWQALPPDTTLADADPSELGGLYDAAEAVHRDFLVAIPRSASGVVAGLLHLTRPALYPVLDVPIRRLYDEPALGAWHANQRATKPRSGRSYWPPLRTDVVGAEHTLEGWRTRLAASNDIEERRVSTLSDVRLWEIMASGLGRESPAHM